MKRIYLSLSLLLLVIIGSRAANFKFAFLTDIHITAGDSITSPVGKPNQRYSGH